MTSDPSSPPAGPPSSLTYLQLATSETGSTSLHDGLERNAARLAADGVHLRSIEPSSADPATIVASLGRVEVVVPACDLVRAVPAAWLGSVERGGTDTFASFVTALIDEPGGPASQRFWALHDLAEIVSRWAQAVGPERVHVVTVPPDGSPSTLLWERFCSVLGTDPDRYDASPRPATRSPHSSDDAELLRRINVELGGALGPEAYDRYVRGYLVRQVLQLAPPALEAIGRAWAGRAAADQVDAITRFGVDVVGDLAELGPPAGEADADVHELPAVQYPETAVRAMAALLRKLGEMEVGTGLEEPPSSELVDPPPPHTRERRRDAARRNAHERESRTVATQGRRTFLHIGTYKTGTSFIQSVLLRNRDLLADHDVCYPTDHTNWRLQTHGVRGLLAQPDAERDGVGRLCRRLVDTILMSGCSTAVVSVERLSTASAAQARALVRSLQPTEVHVIMTLRDLVRVLPSDWQSKIKQGGTWSFAEYAAAAARPRGSGGRANKVFWGHHDAVGLAKNWLAAVGPDRFHVVTVPPAGAPPSLLWERFCSVLGTEPGRYDISQDAKSNFSLTFSDTEFLRQVNRSVGQSVDADARKHWVTRFLANEVLRPASNEPTGADRPRLDPDTMRWFQNQAAEIVDGLRDLRPDVVGDLDELLPTLEASSNRLSQPAIEFPERAAELVAALISKLAEVDGTIRTARRRDRRTAAAADPSARSSRRPGARRGGSRSSGQAGRPPGPG